MIKKISAILMMSLCLSACGEREDLAPVEELKWRVFNPHAKQYTVVRGDTLYSVAFRYDLDYRQMAAYNHLQSPYTLRIGQVLRLKPQSRTPSVRTSSVRPTIPAQRHFHPVPGPQFNSGWVWPAHGRVVAHFSPQRGIKGVNIAGKKGDKIVAASDGVVAYSGSGLAGYGNLIIIKHGKQFLTAYGNNLQNIVHEGQTVKKGQVIADMGIMERHYWGVHFEIRQMGKPVNPLNYLK